jgi:hypothetical protein
MPGQNLRQENKGNLTKKPKKVAEKESRKNTIFAEKYDTVENMNMTPLKNDTDLINAFEEIAKSSQKEYIRRIAKLVVENEITKSKVRNVLSEFSIQNIKDIKNELLDVLIDYANLILEDNILTENEKTNFGFLKLFFEIKGNDFYKNKYQEIKIILQKEFEKLYADDLITQDESEYTIILQDMFDLGYDQFDKLKEEIVLKSIERGAIIANLDTANKKAWKRKKIMIEK